MDKDRFFPSLLSHRGGLVLGAQLLALLMMASAANAVATDKTFMDCADCPEMVTIPAGSFEMGSPNDEFGRFDAEGPLHRVEVAAFALAKTHVTRGQFADFVRDSGYQVGGSCYTLEGGRWEDRPGRGWRDPGYPQKDSHPAVCLSWGDARAYVEWLSRKTGKQYRLPTEAQWEYAARAGTSAARYWGQNPNQACTYANVMDSVGKAQAPGVALEAHDCADGYAYTAPVANFKANAFGLYDMLGNAWQWVDDCLQDDYVGAPADGRAWLVGKCKFRVLRGGSWNAKPRNVRTARRLGFKAGFRYFGSGLRPARMLP